MLESSMVQPSKDFSENMILDFAGSTAILSRP